MPDENISKGEIKKLRSTEAVKKKNIKRAIWAAVVILVLAGLVWGVIFYAKSREKSLPGEFIPDQGKEHVGPGHPHTYNSNPPTSGPHFAQTAEWGIYKEELADETLIHNLEHGGIWISYRPGIAEDIKQKLENFYNKHGRKIIVTPRSKNDTDIALAAWNRLDKFNVSEYSDKRVERFIKAFRNRGPEFVP